MEKGKPEDEKESIRAERTAEGKSAGRAREIVIYEKKNKKQ